MSGAPGRRNESVRAEVGNIATLDGMRGIAVLWVILFHFHVLRPDDPWVKACKATPLEAWIGNGYLGVDLFFVISGFLLALPWFVHAQAGRGAPSMRAFYVRRFWRIAPAYYVQLVFLFLVVLPVLRGPAYWRGDLWVYVFNAGMHATFMHNTTPLTSGSMAANGALWTLGVEAWFYALLPIVMPLFVRWPRAMALVSLALAQAWRIGTRDDLAWLVDAEMALGRTWSWPEEVVRYLLLHQLPSYFGHFGLGIALGAAWLKSRAQPLRRPWLLDAMALAGLVLLEWVLAIDGNVAGSLTWALPAISLAAILYWGAARRGWTERFLARGPLAFAGRISYSAYLYHLPLLLVINPLAGTTGPAAVFPAYLVAVTAISWMSWRFVEKPLLHGLGEWWWWGLPLRARPDRERRPDGEDLQRGHTP